MRLRLIIVFFLLLFSSNTAFASTSICKHDFSQTEVNDIYNKIKDDDDNNNNGEACKSLCSTSLEDWASKKLVFNDNFISMDDSFKGSSPIIGKQIKCVCFYEPIDNDEIVLDHAQCSYVITKTKPVSINFGRMTDEGPIVKNLIKVVTFQKLQSVGEKTGFASAVISNVYYRGLHYFTSYYALILLTILFAGTLFLFSFGNFYQVLKSPQSLWSLLTGTDFKAKASQVMVAIVFFGLPINIENLPSDTQQGQSQNTTNNVFLSEDIPFNYDPQDLLYIYTQNGVQTCKNELESLASAKVEYQKCLANNPPQQQPPPPPPGSQQAQQDEEDYEPPQPCDQERKNYETAWNTYIECMKDNPEQFEEFFSLNSNNNNNNSNSLFKKRKVSEGLQVPFATSIVTGFVNFGVNSAEKVSKWSSEAVKQYLYYKLVKNNQALTKSLQGINAKLSSQINVDSIVNVNLQNACGITTNSCDELLNKDWESTIEYKNPFCVNILNTAKNLCDVNEKLKSSLNKLQTVNLDNVQKKYSGAIEDIESRFSFLSPAIIPVVMVTYPFSAIKEPSQPLLTISKVDGTFEEMKSDYLEKKKPVGFFGKAKAVFALIKGVWNENSFTNPTPGTEADIMIEQYNNIVGNAISKDKEFAYWLGYSSVMSNVPPASFVKRHLSEIFTKLVQSGGTILQTVGLVLSTIAGTVTLLTGIGAIGTVVTSLLLIGTTLLKLAIPIINLIIDVVITNIAVNISAIVFMMLPFLAITIAGVVRFIHYIYEICKTMIALPFYALPVATRRTEGVFVFVGDIVKLSIVPMLIASGVAFAIFFALIFEYFIFDIPFALVVNAVNPSKYTSLIIFGVVTAMLHVVTSLVSTYYLFRVTMGFPEYIISAIGRLLQISSTGEYKDVAQQTFSYMKTHLLAKF